MKNFTILISVLMIQGAYAQQSRLKYANKQYDLSAYFYAAEGYEDVLDRGTDSVLIADKIAKCYDKIENVRKAVEWYDFIENHSGLTKDQLLRSAIIRRQIGDYEGSKRLLKKFEETFGGNLVSAEILNSDIDVNSLKANQFDYNTQNLNINTKASQFGAAYINESTLIVSSAKGKSSVKQIHSWSGTDFYNVFITTVSTENELNKLKPLKGNVNTKFHDGPMCFDSVHQKVYFTRDNFNEGKKGFDKNNLMRLKIYSGVIDGDKVVDIKELPFNSDDFSTGHPAISSDGKFMFFVSDRPNGFGGTDIYKIQLNEDGSFGQPINLGSKINTELNEFTPHFLASESILFFSSEGHTGLGGLDVFAAKMDDQFNSISILNVGSPINSQFDDFSYVVESNQRKGFFTSNRDGGKGSDDLYSFNQIKPISNSPVLIGVLTDKLTKEILANTQIYILDENQNIIDTVITNEKGDYYVELPNKNKTYQLKVNESGYEPVLLSQEILTTNKLVERNIELMPDINYFISGLVKDKDSKEPLNGVNVEIKDNVSKQVYATLNTENGIFKTNIIESFEFGDSIDLNLVCAKNGYLSSSVNLNELLGENDEIFVNSNLGLEMKKIVLGKTDLNDVIDIKPIFFDYRKWNIRPDAAKELDKIVKIMKEHPGMVIELGSHTDSRGSSTDNLSLSDKRAKSSAAYIVSKGIDKNRIIGKGYGETKLVISDEVIAIAPDKDEMERLHQLNRRTEFVIVKMK